MICTKAVWRCKIIFTAYLDSPCPANQKKTKSKKLHIQNLSEFSKTINQQISCTNADRLCLSQSILPSHIQFLYLYSKAHYSPHIAILEIMTGHNTWCSSFISLAILIAKSLHFKHSPKNKLFPCLAPRGK